MGSVEELQHTVMAPKDIVLMCLCISGLGISPGNANETCLDKPAEIAFVVDSSGSMKESWPQVKKWLEALVDAYKIDGMTRKGGLAVWSDNIHKKETIRFDEKKTAAEL